MTSHRPSPTEVFVSYSSQDVTYKDELLKQLRILANQGVISTWHDGLLIPGQEWNVEILAHLKSSRLILLLISPDFLISDYVNTVELKQAAERYRRKEISVIPVLVRNVHGWEAQIFGDLKLGDLHALPGGKKFIVESANPDKTYAEVAKGIQEAVEQLEPNLASLPLLASIPRPPIVGFVARRDSEGRDIVERLKDELAPQKNQLVVLSGPGGVGKTTLAAETTRALTDTFADRIVWISALGREDFALSTLLDEIGTQLDRSDLRSLAPAPKAEQTQALLASASTLVILDNFETIAQAEQVACVEFLLDQATCPALITTRQRIPSARNIAISVMSPDEAEDFLQRLIKQASDASAFAGLDRDRIMTASDRNPLVLQWVVAQIDLAQEAQTVLDELTHGEGDAAQRVFDRSFRLEQLGDDGRAALLALSLFAPDASRAALAVVSGFGDDMKRLNEAVKRLAGLWLVKTASGGSRLTVAGLTRELAKARLLKTDQVDEFRRRFVDYFRSYVSAHANPIPEDFDAVEIEKDNVLGAIDAAFDLRDWLTVELLVSILVHPVTGVLVVHGYWDEALRRGEQGLESARERNDEWEIAQFAGNMATILQMRGEHDEARKSHEQALIAFRKLGSDENVAVALHQLAMLYHFQGELDVAGRLYDESLEIEKKLGNQRGIAADLHQLALLAEEEGELDEAHRLCNESLDIYKGLSEQDGISANLNLLAVLAQNHGRPDEAQRLYNESLAIKKKLGDQSGIADNLHQLGRLAHDQNELDGARRLFDKSLEINKRLGNQGRIAIDLQQLALLAQAEGEFDEARRLCNESLEINTRQGNQIAVSVNLHQLALLAHHYMEFGEARRLLNEGLAILKRLGNRGRTAITVHQLGLLAESEGHNTEAAQFFGEALAIFEKLKSPHAEIARQNLERVKGKTS